MKNTRETLESIYKQYNRPEYLSTDPLEFLHFYPELRDREIVALIASALAYGRVVLIRRSVSRVLEILGPRPSVFLSQRREQDFPPIFQGFCHRFCKAEHLAALFTAIKRLLETHGGLEQAYSLGTNPDHDHVMPSMGAFYNLMSRAGLEGAGHLIPDPFRGSACKRFNLFLRWMVRKDQVDPGGWTCVHPGQLIVPMDVHMGRICRSMALTSRKQNDLKTALEATRGFGEICPRDPVRYDFALTRVSMENPELFF
ncbi:MAG: TIGR02757 family protein [Desulfatibacillum sp.]|nr:TIGR02757 family protein [Desulfatibacillum sp.]